MRANRHWTDDEWTSRLLGDFERLTAKRVAWSGIGLVLMGCLVILLFTF